MLKGKKIINKIVILSTLAVLLSSCNNVVVREDLKEFIKDFSITHCMETYKNAEVTYTSQIKDKGETSATRDVFYSFDMTRENDYESIYETTNTGIYVTSSYPAYKYQHVYKSENEEYDYQEMSKPSSHEEETFSSYLTAEAYLIRLNTFYRRVTESEGGNTAGMYYGDDIKARIRYQFNMRIDTDRNVLIYEAKNIVDEQDNVTSLYYEVNHDGMLLYWKQSGFTKPYDNPERTYFAEMQVTYK